MVSGYQKTPQQIQNKTKMSEVKETTQTESHSLSSLVSGIYCDVCKSKMNVRFVHITDCNLCEKCDNDMSESFELAGKMDRSDYPEL